MSQCSTSQMHQTHEVSENFLPTTLFGYMRNSVMRRWYWPPSTRWWTPASYLQVKDAELHSIRRLAVGQEVVVIEDAANSLVWWGGFGLGGQARGFRVYSVVQVPEQRHLLALWCFNMTNNVFIWLHCVMSKWWISSLCRRENKTSKKKNGLKKKL